MNKPHLSNWLSALCTVLLVMLLFIQSKQRKELASLRQQHDASAAATEQRHKESSGAVAKLADQVLTLDTNWEAELTSRLNAKSDEVVAAFSTRLNEKATEAAAQVASVIRLQAETALKADATERSNKTVRLIEAASRYEKSNRFELAELCYLSALKCSDGNVSVALKPFLAWKEHSVEAMTENEWLTKSPATLMGLYETLDKVLPDSSASPEDMENALAATDRIRGRIVERQQAKMKEIRRILSWDTFDVARLATYRESRDTLASFSPANQELENEKSEIQEIADNLIQSARAMDSFSTTDILPPSPNASVQALTNWFERGLAFVTTSTNTLEARLGAVSILMDFAQTRAEIPECRRYSETLTNESVKLACAQWGERVTKYGSLLDQKDKPDADTFAVGQSLLNQGLAIMKSFTNTITADVGTTLPGLASKLYLQRELLLVNQERLVSDTNVFSSKEQAARARSFLYGQIMSAVFDVRAVESEIIKECNPTSGALVTLKAIQKRFGEYLTAYDKFDQADREDEKAAHIAKLRQQYQRYANHCDEKINEGIRCYNAAKKVADEVFSNWGNERAQAKLKDGLSALYSIDINDLNRANPGLAAKWSRIEDLLKKNYNGVPVNVYNVYAETPRKSLNDF